MSSRLKTQGFVNRYRKLLFGLLSAALVAYLLLFPAIWTPPGGAVAIMHLGGVSLIAAGCLLRILCTISIGGHKDHQIITTEVYSICRNPLYFSSFLMAVGLGLFTARPDFVLLCTGAFLSLFIPMMRNEARYLRERFPEYALYEHMVPLFFPNLRLWHSRDRFDMSFRLVIRTARDASILFLLLPVLCLLDGFHGFSAQALFHSVVNLVIKTM